MSFPEVMGLMAGALQFVVAGYALRLNRLFGTARVGWSLFGAFLLLALLHITQSVTPFSPGMELGVKIEVIYTLISLLLLTGMVHMEMLLKERSRLERQEQLLRAELESEVRKQTAHLTRAIEQLQSEIDERRRAEVEVAETQQKLLAASRQAGMAEIANSVLDNVGMMLRSVNASAGLVSDQVKQSKIANVVRVGVLIREHVADLGDFMARDPRGQKLPLYIAQLAEHLAGEQASLSTELESLRKNIEHIKEVIAIQQNYAQFVDAAGSADGVDLIEDSPAVNRVVLAPQDTQVFHEYGAPGLISPA